MNNQKPSFSFESGNNAGRDPKSPKNPITWPSLQVFLNQLQPEQTQVEVKITDLEFPRGLEFLSEVNPAQFANFLNTKFPANDPREADKKNIIQLIRRIILNETNKDETKTNISNVSDPLNVQNCADVRELLIASGLFTKAVVINPKENYTSPNTESRLNDPTSTFNDRYVGTVTKAEFDGWSKEKQQAYKDKNK
jgi:hypothetical protein